jgi:hypothetical protein
MREVIALQATFILHNTDYTFNACKRGTVYSGLRQVPYLAGKKGERKMAHTELDLRERRTIEDMLNAKM